MVNRPSTGWKCVVAGTAALLLTGCSGASSPEETPSAPEPSAPALDSLLSAEVPTLCEHPAGELEEGVLPGIAEMDGRVQLHPELLEDLHTGAEDSDYAVRGETEAGEPFIAAAVYCDRGGVSWPGQVLTWNADGEHTGVFEPSSITGGDRESVMAVLPAENGVSVRWIATNDFDAACCGQLSAEVDLEVTGDGATPDEPIIRRGEDQVRAVTEAAARGEEAAGVVTADGLYDNLAVAIEKTGGLDPEGVRCADAQNRDGATVACGIPALPADVDVSFVVYPTLVGWNDYEIVAYDQELW